MGKISATSVVLMSLVFGLVAACATAKGQNRDTMTISASVDMSPLEKKFYQATAQLFVNDEGDKRFLCTATAFAKEGKITYLISAAHCASEDDALSGRVNISKEDFFINFNDDLRAGTYYPVKIIGAGYQHAGDDLLFLAAELDRDIEIIPLAENEATLGENITNVACPGGYGKQLFRGSVSLTKVLRSLVFNDINWTNNMFVQGEVGPGSSGSSVASVRQKAIVAIVVGRLGNSPSVVTVPVSRVKSVWAQIRADKYPHKMRAPSVKETKNGDANGPSTEKLIEQINNHYPNMSELHQSKPERLPMTHQKSVP